MLCRMIEKGAGLAAVRGDVAGSACTTFTIGGPLACLAEPQDVEQLCRLLRFLSAEKLPYRILGNGSNLLVNDAGVAECVIRLGKGFRYCREAGTGLFESGGGTSLMSLSRELSEQGIAGLEFAGGIPGSLGGAVCMNAGAHGGEMAQLLQEVEWVSADGEQVTTPASCLAFAYRHSELPAGAVVTRMQLKLAASDAAICRERRAHFLAERKARQPLTASSAGSVFRNPSPDRSAGYLIEQAGLKGRQLGGAAVSTLHANWIINPDRQASARDVLGLIGVCQEEVKAKFGVLLKPEVVLW